MKKKIKELSAFAFLEALIFVHDMGYENGWMCMNKTDSRGELVDYIESNFDLGD